MCVSHPTSPQVPAPVKAARKETTKEQQKEILITLMKEFPTKAVPEIGGLLKGNGFDIEVYHPRLGVPAEVSPPQPQTLL